MRMKQDMYCMTHIFDLFRVNDHGMIETSNIQVSIPQILNSNKLLPK